MQALAHTWILRELVKKCPAMQQDTADIFVYNISPDFLPAHPDITAETTHQIARFTHVPHQYRKAHYVQFHLLADDFSHHGEICGEVVRAFNPHAGGYAYVMGSSLVAPIMEYCRERNVAIEHEDAVYYSHMIIELSVDIYLRRSGEGEELAGLFGEAINQTAADYFPEFAEVLAWTFAGVNAAMIKKSLQQLARFYRADRLISVADAHDRIQYYVKRLGETMSGDRRSYEEMNSLVETGLALIGDPKDYLREVVQALLESSYCREITKPL